MINEKINFSITPEDVIRRAGWAINRTTKCKLVLRRCPACNGGDNRDERTFFVNADRYSDYYGAYKCSRLKCLAKGNFWMLIRLAGMNPKTSWKE